MTKYITDDSPGSIPPGHCQCGCGKRTAIASRTRRRGRKYSTIAGQPNQFAQGHKQYVPLQERFWQSVDRRSPDECWPWIGAKNSNGYGKFRVFGPSREKIILSAHRLSYILEYGPVDEGFEVCHKCDNPPCVNPNHLFVGTHQENMLDRSRKGRFPKHPNVLRGESHPHAKLKWHEVVECRALYSTGEWAIRALARRYSVDKNAIKNIVTGRTRKHG